MARPKRFELLTPRFVVWCSIQLSYGRVFSRGPRTYASRPLMASLGGSVAWGGFWPRPAPAVFASRKGCRRFQVPDRAGYIYKCAPRAPPGARPSTRNRSRTGQVQRPHRKFPNMPHSVPLSVTVPLVNTQGQAAFGIRLVRARGIGGTIRS